MKKGSTLVELIITVAVLAILVTISFFVFGGFNRRQSLEQKTATAISFLTEAKTLTLSSRENTVYGIHFEEELMVRFKGETYDPDDSSNHATSVGPTVSISDISLSGGGSEVVFKRLSGETDNYGTITFSTPQGESKTVTVHASGVVE
ncbi:MAG: prepilin-type N-terminal cleavage/methylation domain-containing protein [bacterium]|nr:prepilin-type N-terminal cleavage/methylation domain-containing protein [bacterium]